MKAKILILSISILLVGLASSCGNKKDTKTSDPAKSDSTQIKGQRIGSDKLGYVTVPKEWLPFKDLDETIIDLQYSDLKGTTIITMNLFDKSGLSAKDLVNFGAKEAAINVWKNLEAGATKVEGNEFKFGKYESFQLYATYPNGIKLTAWLFEAEDGQIHYIAIESPSLNTVREMASMLEHSFSLKK